MTFRLTPSYWLSTATQPTFGPLRGDLEVDVAIIGAGVTGITAAILLQRAGKRVAVLEAERVFGGVTGHTTAHLTEAIDTRFKTLTSDFGKSGATLAAQASRAAIDRIEAFVDERGIECDFRRLPGYLYTEDEIGDRLKPAEAKSVDDVWTGEGKIVSCNGRRLAVYRTNGGEVHAVSPVCTHLGCYVRFNDAEKTWDCPCHGSRLDTKGDILNGPALTPLERVDLTAEKKS